MTLLAAKSNALEFILILIIFVLVLFVTFLVTKWTAGYQKGKGVNGNIELKDCASLGPNKYVQIVRVGETFYALAVCKDTVTLLGEISDDQLKEEQENASGLNFKDILHRVTKKNPEGMKEPKETTEDDESTSL